MRDSNPQFLMGLEQEFLTVLDRPTASVTVEMAIRRLFKEMEQRAPSLPGSSGFFNGYGRVYVDTGSHVEFASSECDSPYQLAQMIEQQLRVASEALETLAREGIHVVLANTNHSGLLTPDAPTFGTHENYLVSKHPTDHEFTDAILPFHATRFYGGSGGIEFPTGKFVACTRMLFIRQAVGGSTTSYRALHSTARDEPHMSLDGKRFRYHHIAGDGLRSPFGVALRAGATALVVRAVTAHPKAVPAILGGSSHDFWLRAAREYNLLAKPGQPPRVAPAAFKVQRTYWDLCRAYFERISRLPDWISRALDDWDAVLTAVERNDVSWLAARLDPWIKHTVFSSYLAVKGITWKELPHHIPVFNELALLNQHYHEFADPASPFAQLDHAGILWHRGVPESSPGPELEPYVPQTSTRARARARFIREHQSERTQFVMDWAAVYAPGSKKKRPLAEPFAQEYGPWRTCVDEPEPTTFVRIVELMALRAYDRGDYERGSEILASLPERGANVPSIRRVWAWIQARRGYLDGVQMLDRIYQGREASLSVVADYVCCYRYMGLMPPDAIWGWIERGNALLAADPDRDPSSAVPFLGHVAYTLLRHGRADEALDVLERVRVPSRLSAGHPHAQARILAELGEAHRMLGDRQAARWLREAKRIHRANRFHGDLADFTWTYRAKLEPNRRRAMALLGKIKTVQLRLHNRMGECRTLLLEARLADNPNLAESNRRRVLELRQQVPALGQCPRLAMILDNWDAWVHDELARQGDDFWGV
jgi:proteasome accessory factor A